MRNLFSGAFKDNSSLAYSFMTGIRRMAKESIFSGMNNLKVNTITTRFFLDHLFYRCSDTEAIREDRNLPRLDAHTHQPCPTERHGNSSRHIHFTNTFAASNWHLFPGLDRLNRTPKGHHAVFIAPRRAPFALFPSRKVRK